jgi:hypothetical protein
VLIAYDAFPIDKDGFPLIPDNIKFKRAVEQYIIMKADYILFRKGDISSELYNDSKIEWCWAVGGAQTAGVMPSLDQLESIKNMMVRVVPKLNQHRFGFKFMNVQEKRIR